MELFIAWTLLSCLVVQVMGQEQSCFTSGSIAGAVLGTFFATVVALAIGAFIYFKCCHKKTPGKNTEPGANVEVGTRGFDNPCFEQRASGRGGNDRRTSNDGPQAKRQEKGWTQFRLLPLTRSTERKAADDSFVTALERIEVPLRGHDFTGLGFNIAGNMRDGIYVKDVQHRGPASESGQITPGDRIESMTVSFRHMVFEDALTILSYASPYDVTLTLEKSGMQGKLVSPRRATSAASLVSPNVTVSGNLSGDIGSPGRLVHPLFRSQSIDDLSHIGKADLGAKVSVKLPSVNAKLAHNKIQNRDANIEIETPTLELPTGLDAKIGGGAIVSGAAKTTKFGVKVLPDLKFKGKADMEGIDIPDSCTVSIDTPSVSLSGPGKANIGVKAPKVKSGIDVNLPSADLNLKVPDLNVQGLKVRGDAGLDDENGKGKKSTSFSLKMPRLSFGKASAGVSVKPPKVDVEMQKSDVAIDIADLPGGKLDANLKGKKPEINLKMPQINVDVPSGSKKFKGKVPDANISADLSLPSAEVDVSLPEAELSGDVKVKKPKFGVKMPGMNIGMPSLNLSSNSGSIEGKVPNVSGIGASITKPELDVNLPAVEIEAKGIKGSAGIKMPKLNVDVPSAEINPVNPPEMSVNLPGMPDLSLSTKGAKLEGDLSMDMPDFEKADKKGKKSKFSLKMPNMNFGKGGAEIPVDIETGGVNLPKPEISLSGIQAPNVDISLQPPNVEGGIAADIDGPHAGKDTKAKFAMKMPSLNIGKHDAEFSLGAGAVGGLELDRTGISAELPDIKAPKLNVNLPELSSGSISIPNPEFSANIGGIDGKISMPEVTLPEVSAGMDLPNADLNINLQSKKPKLGVKLPNMEIDKPNVDLKLDPGSVRLTEIPDVNLSLEAPKVGVDLRGPEIDSAVEMPKIKSDIKLPTIEVNLEGKLPKMDISGAFPSISANKSKEIEIEAPEIDLDGVKGKKGKFSMKLPSFGFGKADASVEGVDIEGKLPKPEISVGMPEIPDVNVSLKGPKAAIDLPDVHGDKKGKKSKFSMKMPHLNLGRTNSGSSIESGHLEGHLPRVEGDVEIDTKFKAPRVDVELPDVDIEGGKGKKSKFSLKMPHMNFGRHNGSDGSINVDIPNVKGAVEIPDANVKLQGPKLDVNLPDVELGGSVQGKKSKYNVKLPQGVDIDAPKVDISAGISGTTDSDFSLKGSEVEIGLKDANLPEMKGKKSKFSIKMPHMGFGKPHAELNVDSGSIDGKLAQPEVSVSLPDMPDTSISLPKAEIGVELPEFELGDKKGKKSKFSMKTPNISFGKPQVELDLKAEGIEGKLPKPDLSVTVPEVPDVDISVKPPQVDVNAPEIDLCDMKGKKSKFSMKMPSLGFGKPHLDLNLGADAKLPKPEVSVALPEVPDVNISVNAPEVDIEHPELDVVDLKFKKPKFSMKMPSLGFGKHHAEADLDVGGVDVKLMKPEVSVNLPEVPDVDFSVKAPEVDVDIEHPDLDLGEMKGKKSKFSMKMPSLGFGKPNLDLNLGADAKVPKPEVSVALPEVPDVNISVNAPEVDIEHPELDVGDLKFKKPKFSMKMPSLGFGKHHAEADLDVDVKLVKPEVSVNLPEIPDVDFSAKAPEVDVDIEHPDLDLGEMKGKKSKFSMKMPNLSFGKPHLDVSLGADAKVPKPEVSVAVPEVPDMAISVNAPDIDISNPELNLGDVKGKKSKFSMKMPGLNLGKPHMDFDADVKIPKPELSVSVPEVPDVDISLNAPDVDVEHPDLDLSDLKGKKPKFSVKMPGLKFGKPHADISLGADGMDAKLIQPEVSVSVPEVPDVNVSLNAPEVDIAHPDLDLGDVKGKKSKFSMKMPNLSFGKPHGEFSLGADGKLPKPEMSVNLPEAPDVNISLNAPEVDISDPELDIGDLKGKKSKFSMNMPNVKMPNVKMPNVSFGKPDVDISAPDVDIDIPNIEFGKGKKSKFAVKMPNMSFDKAHAEVTVGADGKLPKPELSVEVPEVPDVDISINAPGVDIENPDFDMGDLKGKKPKFSMKMPSISFGKPHGEVSIGADGKLPKPDLSVALPEVPDVDVSLKAPEIEIEHPDLDLGDMKGKKSKFSMKIPSLSFGKPHTDVTLGADGKLPKPELSVEVPEVPDVNVSLKAPELDIEHPELDLGNVKGKKPKFSMKMPSFGKPHVDVSLGTDGIEAKLPKADVSVPDVNVSLNAPQIEIEHPELDLGDMKGKKSKFSMKMPNLSFGKPHADVSIGADGKLPKPELSVNVPEIPNVDISLKAPEVDIEHPDIDVGDMKGKKSKFSMKMPGLNFGKPHLDVDFDAKLPKPEVSVNVPEVPDVDVSFKAPEVDISHPELDLGDAKGKKSKFSVKMPHISFGKPHGDISLGVDGKLPKPEASVPDVDISVDAPDVDISHPDIDLGDLKGKKSKFSMKMPGLKFGKPHLEGDLGAGVKLPEPEISVTVPDIPDVDISAPDVDFDIPDIELGKGKKSKFAVKMPNVKMPNVNFGKPTAELSLGADGKLPHPELSVNVPEVPDVDVSLKAPEVDISLPEMEIGDLKGKKSKFSVKMPNVKMPNMSFGKPHAEVTLDTEGSVTLPEVPDVDISVKAPAGDIDAPEIDIGDMKGKKSKFSMKMPSLGFGKPNLDFNLGADAKLPKPEVSVALPEVPDVNISVNAPEADIEHPELDVGDLKFKKPKFSMKMPSLGFGKHHAEADLDVGGVDVKLVKPEVSVNLPEIPDVDFSVKAPEVDVDIEHPDVDLGEMKGKKPKFSMKMPNLSFGKPHLDVSLGADAKVPKLEVSAAVPELPDMGISVNAPDIDISNPELNLVDAKGKKSKFSMKMPGLNLGKPHMDFDADVKIPKPELSVSVPEVPDVDVSLSAPEVEIEHPDLDLCDMKGKKSKFSMKMPSMNFGMPHADYSLGTDGKLPKPELSVNVPEAPELNISLNAPEVDISKSELDVDGLKGKKSKFSVKMPNVKMPNVSFGKPNAEVTLGADGKLPKPELSVGVPETPDVDISMSAPEVEIEHPDFDLGDMKGKKSKFSMKMPNLSFGKPHAEVSLDADGKLPKPEMSVSLPEVPDVNVSFKAPELEIDHPDLDLGDLKGKKSKFSMKMPNLNFGKPHAEINVGADGKLPKSEVSVALPEVPDVNVSVNAPDFEIEHPELDLGDLKGKKSKFSMKMPTLNIGKPHGDLSIQTGGTDVKLPKPELSVNVPDVPDVNVSLNAPEVDISHPDLDLGDLKGKKSKFSMKMPNLGFGKPHAEISLGVDGKLPKPELSINVPDVPDVNISVNEPEVEIEHPDVGLGDSKGKKSKFSMKMPSLGFGKSHAEVSVGADGIDAQLPKPEISVPDVNVSLNAPDVDVGMPDIDVGDLKGKKQKFSVKMPGLNFGKPHADLSLQTAGADVKLPKPELSVNVPEVPNVNVSFKAPEVDVSLPELDIGEMKGKKSTFSVKMPGLNFGEPHADVTLGAEGKLPKPELSVEVPEVPDVNIALKAPELDIDQPELELGEVKGKKSKFSVKMPSLGFGKPHAQLDLQPEDVDANVSVTIPKASVELPDVETEDLKGKKSKFSIKMPHLNFGKPHLDTSVDPKDLVLSGATISATVPEIPDVDVKLRGPRLELEPPAGNVSVTLPKMPDASVTLNPPCVELQSDGVDLPHGKHKKGKFSMKMPNLSFGKHHSEVALEGHLPEPSLTASTPSIDLSLKAPSAGLSSEDLSIPNPEFSASLPEATKPNWNLGNLNVEADSDLPDVKTNKSKFNLKMPHVSIGKPRGEVSGAAIQLPQAEIDMNLPAVGVQLPARHLEGVDVSADISSPFSEIDQPDLAASSKVNVKLPKLQTDVGGISAEMPGLNVKSEGEIELDDQKHRLGLKLPKLKPEANLQDDLGGATGHLATSASNDQPKVSVAFRAPTFGLKTSTPVVQVPTPSVTAQGSVRAGSEVSEIPEDDDTTKKEPSKKKFGIKFPKLHMGKSHHELEVDPADVDINLRVKAPHIDVESSEGAAVALPSSDDVKLKKAMKVGVQVPSFAVREKEDLDAQGTFKLPRVRVSKNIPQDEHKTAKLSDKESDDDDDEKPRGLRFGIKLKKSKGNSKSSSKTSLEEPVEIKIPRVDLSKKGSVELEGMEGLSPRDRAEMIKKNAKVSAGVRHPKYRGSLPGEDQEPQLLGITRIPSVVENFEQHGYTEMAVDVPQEFLERDRALKGISNIVPSSFKVMVPLMNVQVEDTTKVTVPAKEAEATSVVILRGKPREAAPKDVSANFVTENVVVTDAKGRKAASLGDLTRIVAVNDDSSLERTVSLDLRVGSDAVLSLGTNRRSYPDHPVQDLSRVSAEDLATSKRMSQGFQNLALSAEEQAEEKPFNHNNAPETSTRSVLAIEVNEAVWNPTSLYVSSYGPNGKAFISPNSDLTGAAIRGRADESLSADTTITLESTPTASSNSSSRTSPLPLTEVRSSFTTVTLSNGSHGHELMELSQSELKNVTFTPVFHQEHVEVSVKRSTEAEDDPSVNTFAVVRERFEQLSRHSSAVEIGKANDGHRVTVETNLRWEDSGSRHESPVQKPVMQIKPVVEEGALSKTVVISGLQLEQCDTSLQEVMSVESPVPTLEKPL